MDKEVENIEENLEDKVCDVCGKQVQNEDYETIDRLIEYIVEDGGMFPREHMKFCSEECFNKWVKEKVKI